MRAQISTRINTGTKPAGLLRLLAMLVLVMAVLSPLAAQAQGNYVYVNNQAAANTVSGYSVSATGALTQLSGSPFSTGGVGANVVCYGLNRITLSPINNLLFVANTGDRTITSFSINPASGILTRVGSPVATVLTLDGCQGISLAATPDGNFLFASSNGQIETFTIGAGGAVTPLLNPVTGNPTITTNCCSPNAGMVISPNGQFLATSNQTNVSMFTINAGVLTPVSGSPFAKTGSGSLSGLDFSCAADRLYAGEATGSPALADAWVVDNTPNIATTGVLTRVPGTPFTSSGNNSNLVLYSPDNSLLASPGCNWCGAHHAEPDPVWLFPDRSFIQRRVPGFDGHCQHLHLSAVAYSLVVPAAKPYDCCHERRSAFEWHRHNHNDPAVPAPGRRDPDDRQRGQSKFQRNVSGHPNCADQIHLSASRTRCHKRRRNCQRTSQRAVF
jgi:hypothetical protein